VGKKEVVPIRSVTAVAATIKPRRVLPEHEGKYKIKLPTGTTERSKEILKKASMLQSQQTVKQVSVFERLSANSISSDDDDEEVMVSGPTSQVVRISGLSNKPISSSIFSRLGGIKTPKDELTVEESKKFAGILKNSPTKATSTMRSAGIVKHKHPLKQKVMLIKKIPAKAAMCSDDDDGSDGEPRRSGGANYRGRKMMMDTDQKTVSFSSEDEVVYVARRPKPKVSSLQMLAEQNESVKSRLGFAGAKNMDSFIHSTKKTVSMKAGLKRRASPLKVGMAKMKSDEMLRSRPRESIRERLSLQSANQLANRIERFSLDSKLERKSKPAPKKGMAANSSVFNRLGFGKN
jgi:Family of unknown function (DUF5577)